MRSSPGRRLTRGARASRRAQVSADNAEQSAPRRRVHALGARGPGAERAPPPERESATRARPGARRRLWAQAPGTSVARGARRGPARGAAGPQEGHPGWEPRGTPVCLSEERWGARAGSAAGANPARIVPRGFNTRRWPRSASKLRYLLLREVPAPKRCSSVEGTVPSTVHLDLLLRLKRKCWLWHRFYLSWQLPFVYLAVLSLLLGGNTWAIWPVSPLKSKQCLIFLKIKRHKAK